MSPSRSSRYVQHAGLLNAEGFLQLHVLRAWVLQCGIPRRRTMQQTVVHNFLENATWPGVHPGDTHVPGVFAGAVRAEAEAAAGMLTPASERSV